MRGCLGKEEKSCRLKRTRPSSAGCTRRFGTNTTPRPPTSSSPRTFFTRDMLAEYQHGVDGYKHLVGWMHTAFPNLHMDIENMIAEGDEVASFVTLSGTHTGPLRDLAPTRKQVSVKHSHWYRLANGKVVETWSVRDDLGMMQQMKSAVSV